MDDSPSLAIGGKERHSQTFSETEAAKESASAIESGLGWIPDSQGRVCLGIKTKQFLHVLHQLLDHTVK